MAKSKIRLKLSTKKTVKELSQLIELLEKANKLIDSISLKKVKNLIADQDNQK